MVDLVCIGWFDYLFKNFVICWQIIRSKGKIKYELILWQSIFIFVRSIFYEIVKKDFIYLYKYGDRYVGVCIV